MAQPRDNYVRFAPPPERRTRVARVSNYARHVGFERVNAEGKPERVLGTGEYVFFGEDVPWFECEEEWVFWRIPSGVDPKTFEGQIVGENPRDSALALAD